MMQVEVLKSKIHRVSVTEARLDYIGSITIDEDLMDAANIIRGEHVYIVDNKTENVLRPMRFQESEGLALFASTGRPPEKCNQVM